MTRGTSSTEAMRSAEDLICSGAKANAKPTWRRWCRENHHVQLVKILNLTITPNDKHPVRLIVPVMFISHDIVFFSHNKTALVGL